MKVPLNTYFQLLEFSDLLTLMDNFLPRGIKMKKPLNIPMLIKIITTPNWLPVAFSNISAADENLRADATLLEIKDS